MQQHNKIGNSIAMLFSIIALALAAYATFGKASPITHTMLAWLLLGFSFVCAFASLKMFSAKRHIPLVINVVCCIMAGFCAILAGTYWLLICLILTLVGCVIYRAGNSAK